MIEDTAVIEKKPSSEAAETSAPASEIKEVPAPAPETKPQEVVSPLLSEPVEIKAHAMGIGPAAAPAQNNDTFKIDGDFFSTPAVQQSNPASNQTAIKTDAPEQSFNPNASPLEVNTVPDKIAMEGSSELCDTIMDLYKRAVPDVSYGFVKVKADEIREIKKLEDEGKIMAGSADDLRNHNQETKKTLQERAKEDAALIKKPLKKLLQVNNVQAPPHIELIIVLLFVIVTYGMMLKNMKEANKEMTSRIFARIDKLRESDVPLAQTDEVKK